MSQRLLPAALALFAALGFPACGEEPDEATASGAEAPPTSGPRSAPRAAEGDAPEPEGVARIRYDLARHLARAEMRERGALWIDFGVPGGAKYTLGGWRTRAGPDRDFDGTSALVFRGVTGKLLLPADSEGAHVLLLRARAFGDGRLTVYIEGETVAHARLPTDGRFETIRIELPAGRLRRGENMLQLRVPRAGAAPGLRAAGLALDWLRLQPLGPELPPAPIPSEVSSPPAPSALLTSSRGIATLSLPAGLSLGYGLVVPPGARLRARLEGESGSLVVRAHRDGAPPLLLHEAEPGPEGAAIDLSLEALAGSFARIDLESTGALRLLEPAIVTLEPVSVTIPSPLAGSAPTPPRNVLIFLIDTLRADRLRPYAPESRVRTPGLDRYVQSATLFLEGHAQENWTKPSIATLLSGLLPWEHTATAGESVLPRSVRILPELLEEHAFQTAAFICNGYVSGDFGFRRGWGSYRNYIKEGRRTQARFVADDVLAWLDGRDTERPFFLYVHTIDPHVPYIPPPELLETYDPEPYDGPVDFRRDRELLEKIKSGQLRLGARDRRRLEALYDGEITYHDVHMAAILDGLERRGLAEETLVIITADHGEEFFDHDSVGHGHSLYEELLHVPFVIRMPGLGREGARIPEAVGLVDLAPTILDALGLEIPEAMSGRSLLPLLRHESESGPRLTVAGFMEGWRALIVGRRKLIQRTEERMMLFDLEADPQEREDLAAERPLELRTLRGLLGLALAGSEGASMPAHRAERTQIDAETEAQLRALGYVGSSRR